MALKDYIYNKPAIMTDRLLIRPMRAGDADALREWMPDPTIYKYWGKGPGRSEKDPALMFEKEERPSKSFHLGIAERSSDRVIGDIWIYLIEQDRMAQAAVRLARAVHGRGYGTESLSAMTRFCFENTELRRLWAKVDAENTASCRMLEKCGYVREGLIRQGRMVNTWCDYYIYGILKSDMDDRCKQKQSGRQKGRAEGEQEEGSSVRLC